MTSLRTAQATQQPMAGAAALTAPGSLNAGCVAARRGEQAMASTSPARATAERVTTSGAAGARADAAPPAPGWGGATPPGPLV